MDDAHRFAPAAPDESIVYGACCPGWHTAAAHDTAIDQWLSFMNEQGIERVCCLVAGRRLDASDANIGRYRAELGAESVCHAPVPDQHLVDREMLRDDVLPFLDRAVADDARVVVHCLAGLGRTGQVLAAWLVHGRGYAPQDAIEAVRTTGRHPMEPIEQGDASRRELLELLDSIV